MGACVAQFALKHFAPVFGKLIGKLVGKPKFVTHTHKLRELLRAAIIEFAQVKQHNDPMNDMISLLQLFARLSRLNVPSSQAS